MMNIEIAFREVITKKFAAFGLSKNGEPILSSDQTDTVLPLGVGATNLDSFPAFCQATQGY